MLVRGKNFSYMFSGCGSLQNINALENCNVSNGIKFECMFDGCSKLTQDKNPANLQNNEN